MPASGLGATLAGDILDFVMRDKLPARGWPNTASWNARERLEAAEWASRLRDMRAWEPSPAVMDQAGEDRVRAWRSLAAAERGWSEVLAAAEQAFEGTGRVSLEAFWRHIETALAFEPIRVPDARREVVHVLDAYEARQWSLPVVFVCGLTERHFPQYHREDPIVGDAALRRAGLDTAADREREERALFELVTTRATALTVLSYPQYDDAGQETLPSFFLPSIPIEDIKTRVRPRRAAATTELVCAGSDPPIPKLSASSIETYLQCPFQFFVKKTLRVIERPDAPRDRLDVLLQGTILHEALAEWVAMPILGDAALEDVFERHCKLKNIPHTYRKEAVRLELLRHFRAFTRDRKLQLTGWTSRMEEPFEFTLPGGPVLRGKIDRLEVDPRKRALVIDYKYSNSNNLTKRMKATEAGDAVQAGIYLLAAEQGLGLRPAGMLFCFAKKGVQWGGWHSGIAGLEEIAEARPEAFAELARNAEETARRVFDEVSRGRISVAPKDTAKCAWCDCSDICRVESIAKVKESGA
jgi:ATP-dependent helicase/DNAse subunit B